jgi:putative transposase
VAYHGVCKRTTIRRYAMKKTNVISFPNPQESVGDALSSVLRQGAQDLLAKAIEIEITSLLASFSHLTDSNGAPQVVRNGYLPDRYIQTGVGPVHVKVPRVRDRGSSGIKFTSALIPPYLRRTKNIEELLPVLYLKGISTGDFGEALEALVGPETRGLSASNICRLKEDWAKDHEQWISRDLSKKTYVYFWVDGIYLKARMEDKQCILVIIGSDEFGNKELVALEDGFRESEQSWTELLLDLKRRGLAAGPKLSVGDGSLGFWNALHKVYGKTRHQRCWVHKTANILNKLPKTLHSKAKHHIHSIWMADTKENAEKSFDFFIEAYQDKYPKATECLEKDRDVLLTFYDFPAEHWHHIRTTNPIESTFATVRLRTGKTRGCLSRKTGLTMVFKLVQSAQRRWSKLRGQHRVAEIIRGVNFRNGIAQDNKITRIAA